LSTISLSVYFICGDYLRRLSAICGIIFFHKELKISQFVDDTSLICSNLISVQNTLLILNMFGILTGLKLNESKTKAIWLGPWKQCTVRPLNFVWTKEPLKILGIYVSYDKAGNERKNVNQKIENCDNVLIYACNAQECHYKNMHERIIACISMS